LLHIFDCWLLFVSYFFIAGYVLLVIIYFIADYSLLVTFLYYWLLVDIH